MIREVRQRKTNTVRFHLYVRSKKQDKVNKQSRISPINTENTLRVAGGGVVRWPRLPLTE